MALQRISFDIVGDEQYVRGFEATAREAADLSAPLRSIGESLREAVAEQFLSEGAAGSFGRWKPLNPAYERAKREAGYGGPILVRTGAMFSAATDERSISVTPRRLVYEIDDPKAIHHQRGDGNLPQRRIVDLSLTTRRQWDRIFAGWLNNIRRGIRGAVI